MWLKGFLDWCEGMQPNIETGDGEWAMETCQGIKLKVCQSNSILLLCGTEVVQIVVYG